MKTEATKQLEKLLKGKFKSGNDFFVFECTIGWMGKEIVDIAKNYINKVGGFEKLAEWGLY